MERAIELCCLIFFYIALSTTYLLCIVRPAPPPFFLLSSYALTLGSARVICTSFNMSCHHCKNTADVLLRDANTEELICDRCYDLHSCQPCGICAFNKPKNRFYYCNGCLYAVCEDCFKNLQQKVCPQCKCTSAYTNIIIPPDFPERILASIKLCKYVVEDLADIFEVSPHVFFNPELQHLTRKLQSLLKILGAFHSFFPEVVHECIQSMPRHIVLVPEPETNYTTSFETQLDELKEAHENILQLGGELAMRFLKRSY